MNEIEYYTFEIDDSEDEDISKLFGECHRIISESEKNEQNILIHCMGGISRSPTIVMAYLMLSRGMSREEAFEYVSAKRFFINPNDGFMKQLKQLECSD